MREGAALTMVGTRLGTLPYMPPEQVKGQDIDGRADLFAVGAVLFRVLSRRRVHEASTEADMIVKMSALPAPSLRSVAPVLSADLCAVIDRALAYQRDKRYPDARSMQADVRALRSGQAPAVAVRLLAELGPPNDLVEPATRRPGTAPLAEPATSVTQVGTPVAAQGAGNASPVSATAAASPFVVSPAGAAGAAAVGPLSQTAQAPASASALMGVNKTVAIPAQLPAALVEPTQLSAGVVQLAAPQTSRLPAAGDGAAGPVEPTAESRTGAMLGGVAAATSPGPASLGAPPVSLGAPPVSALVADEEARRRKRVAVGIVVAAGALALFLVLALWLVFSGEESEAESDADGQGDRSAQAGDDEDDERSGHDGGVPGTVGTIRVPAKALPLTTVARPVATQGKTPTSSPPTTTQRPTATPPAIGGDDDDDGDDDKNDKNDKKEKKEKRDKRGMSH
jgi:serine/threonine-protein kinase